LKRIESTPYNRQSIRRNQSRNMGTRDEDDYAREGDA